MSLSETEFQEFLDTWGSDLDRWPRSHVRAAEELLVRSELARKQMQEMRELDARLAEWTVNAPDPSDIARILGSVRNLDTVRSGLERPLPSLRRIVYYYRAFWPSVAVGLGALIGTVMGFIETDAAVMLFESPDAMLGLNYLPDFPILLGLL